MIRAAFLLIILLFATQVFGANNYYPNGFMTLIKRLKNDKDLKSQLRYLLTAKHVVTPGRADTLANFCSVNKECYSHTPVSYHEARTYLFGHLHLNKRYSGYNVFDLYCEKTFSSSVGKRGDIGPMKIPSSVDINCEHTWPKSHFSPVEPRDTQLADLHHLFPTDSQANAIRGNHPFGEVGTKGVYYGCDASGFGEPLDASGPRTEYFYFEPPDSHKGNVARALFYFAVRYRLAIDELEEFYLRKWHHEDPVDEFEAWRNDEIMKIQGNRNPFIDFPELESHISNL